MGTPCDVCGTHGYYEAVTDHPTEDRVKHWTLCAEHFALLRARYESFEPRGDRKPTRVSPV